MFNWFRRQFRESDQKDEEQQQPTEPAQQSAPPTQSESATEDEDYLSWAKAAYKNIQQQKQASESSVDQSETTEVSQAESAPPDAESETTAVESTKPQEVEEEATSPTAETQESDSEVTAESAEVAEESPTPLPPSAAPAWMRKSDRLERLRETASETPTPEEESIQPTQPAEPEEAGAFDEEFVWSAQVLAAQGRKPEDVSEEEISWLKRLRQGLGKTRRSLVNQLKAVVGQGPLNQDAVTEIEALLLQADVGVEATDYIIQTLQARLREESLPPEEAIAYLKYIIRDLLDQPLQHQSSSVFVPEKDTLNIWLLVGVNGSGKTTTIGKLAHLAQKSGYSCIIAAADTFRAAAVEQVRAWGDRSGTPVIANPGKNTDPAAVVFDGITAAQSRNSELLLVDTAGRLQNKKNLMEELSKIRRIVDKKVPDAKIESLLVIDATLGQNGLRQAEGFSEAANLSGVVLTKLDSSARGGVALAIAQQLDLPIRFIGAGEGIEDLRPFSSYEFVEALLSG